jgi:hypothetical protein
MQIPDRTARRGHATFAKWCPSAGRCCSLRSKLRSRGGNPAPCAMTTAGTHLITPGARNSVPSLRSARRCGFRSVLLTPGCRLKSSLASDNRCPWLPWYSVGRRCIWHGRWLVGSTYSTFAPADLCVGSVGSRPPLAERAGDPVAGLTGLLRPERWPGRPPDSLRCESSLAIWLCDVPVAPVGKQ